MLHAAIIDRAFCRKSWGEGERERDGSTLIWSSICLSIERKKSLTPWRGKTMVLIVFASRRWARTGEAASCVSHSISSPLPSDFSVLFGNTVELAPEIRVGGVQSRHWDSACGVCAPLWADLSLFFSGEGGLLVVWLAGLSWVIEISKLLRSLAGELMLKACLSVFELIGLGLACL